MFEPTYKNKKPSVTDMPVMRSKLRPTFWVVVGMVAWPEGRSYSREQTPRDPYN
jgi:hypothetical protein